MAKSRSMFHHKWRWRRVTQLMARDGRTCKICDEVLDRGVKNPNAPLYITFDHILPRSKGGTEHIDNLRLAHRHCNTKRGSDPIMPEDEAPNA